MVPDAGWFQIFPKHWQRLQPSLAQEAGEALRAVRRRKREGVDRIDPAPPRERTDDERAPTVTTRGERQVVEHATPQLERLDEVGSDQRLEVQQDLPGKGASGAVAIGRSRRNGVGQSNREIARALFVTLKAVEFHLANAYRKLEIGSRTELASVMASWRLPRRARSDASSIL